MAKKIKVAGKPGSGGAAASGRLEPQQLVRYVGWAALAAAWGLTALALLSYDRADPLPAGWRGGAVAPFNAQPHNWIGLAGAALAHEVYLMLGLGVWVFLAAWLALLVVTARRQTVNQPVLRLLGVIIMTLAASAIVGITMPGGASGFLPGGGASGWSFPSGSLVAFYINTELRARFNTLGSMIILGLSFWVGAILAVDQVVLAIPKWFVRALGLMPRIQMPSPALAGRLAGLPGSLGLWGRSEDADAEADEVARGAARDAKRGRRGAAVEEPIDEDAGGLGGTESFDPDAHRRGEARGADKVSRKAGKAKPERDKDDDTSDIEPELLDEFDGEDGEAADETETGTTDETGTLGVAEPEVKGEIDDSEEGGAADVPGAYVEEKKKAAEAAGGPVVIDPDAIRAKIKAMPVNFVPRPQAPAGQPGIGAAPEQDLTGYRFPGMDLLIEPESNFTEEMERMVRDQAVLLEEALQQYRIEGEVVGIDSGPVITLYEVRLAPGTKVAVLNAVSSDLARALKAHNIRIVPNMAGKDTVGIEVPNLVKEKVRLKELMTVQAESTARMALPMFLGKDASGNPLIADLASMPHMLIAGTTGSGKSVCMNSIIMSFLFTKRPDELKMVLVDPKMVEMSQFKDVPHLMCPVVTEMSKAAAILEWAVTKMDERYELLAEAGVRDINGYNTLGWDELKDRFNPSNEEEEARIPKKLPFLVFVIDELADLMMTNKEVEGFIVRIAQKARAVGMHLILATQRPQANVVTGLIKSNMPCRVSFKVASGMDSRIVLDQKGAELLLGQGDMLFLSPRTSKLTRAQGTLVDDGEIRKSVKFLREISEQNFEPQLVQIRGAGGGVDEEAAKDPLFGQAVRCVLQTKRGSVSLLQRRLTIGYSRASRLIEAMATAGILGEYKGSQAREVTITLEEWEAMEAQMAADAAASGEAGAETAEGGEEGGVASYENREPANDDWANAEEDDDAVPSEFDDEFRQ